MSANCFVGSVRSGLILALLCVVGCDQTTVRRPQKQINQAASSDQELIDKALEYLENLDQFREQQALAQAAYHLNRWIENQSLSSSWTPDERVARLPRIVREHGDDATLGSRRFTNDDILALQEAVWMRQVARWVSQQPLPAATAAWLEKNRSRLGEYEADQLAVASRLFDWTVRNIQLTELIPHPEDAASAPSSKGETQQAAEPAAVRGIPGPGYYLEARQVLLYGQGDAWQRMRVFTLLARQQGIDVVTLAFPGKTIPPRPRPWVSGVVVKDQLYLFDAQLGLPLPGRDLEGIATLQQVRDDPTLLSALGTADHPYQVEPRDLAEVAALIDVIAPHLSQRFQLLEKQLLGERRTVLTVALTPLAQKLESCPGVYDVYVWSVPFEAGWFRSTYERLMRNDERLAADYALRFGIFANHSSLARARYLYFRGELDTQDEHKGAKELLMESRINKDDLDALAHDVEIQKQFGLERTNRHTDALWQAQLSAVRHMMLSTKQCASFWLGLFQLESGRLDSAAEWLKSRSLAPWPDGMWAPAARYNLARTYEAQGKLDKAQEVLLADTSPQSQGNYLRARLLQRQLAASSPSSASQP